jgi:hypothetical protein
MCRICKKVFYHGYDKNIFTPNVDLFPTYYAQAAIVSDLGLKGDDL